MPKVRVYEVAKKIGISSKALLEKLGQLGIEAKRPLSALKEEEANKVMDFFAPKPDPKPEPKPKPKPEPKPRQEFKKKPDRPLNNQPENNITKSAAPLNQGFKKDFEPGKDATPRRDVKRDVHQRSDGAQRREAPLRSDGTQRREAPLRSDGTQRREAPLRSDGAQRREAPLRSDGTQRREAPLRSDGAQRREAPLRSDGAQRREAPPRSDGTQRREAPLRSDGTQRREAPLRNDGTQRKDSPPRKDAPFRKDTPQRRDAPQRKDLGPRKDAPLRKDSPPRKDAPLKKNPSATGDFTSKKTTAPKKDAPPRKETPPQKNTGFKKAEVKPQAPQKKKANKKKAAAEVAQPDAAAIIQLEEDGIKIISIPQSVTVKEFSEKSSISTTDIIKRLMKMGIMANINQEIDFYIASQIAEEFDLLLDKIEVKDILEQAFEQAEDKEEDLKERPPVVVVMGHVDHGKTSLLDTIRNARVTAGEAGGITQHIGAYTVSVAGKPITFLDTPGHEAFTAMRMRGARVTDIAILVVAADDGVMPQTIEAINHAKAANVDIIVAINKIDKPSANPDRVKQELTEHGLLSEDWGGETISVPVSALKGEGVETLLEMVVLVAEMKSLKANPNKNARGTVIEALLDKGRGPVATMLVQDGTLKVGDPIVVGATYGKVRAMMDDKGKKVKTAGPSKPVEILGLSEVPLAGDAFYVASNEKQARQYAESIIARSRTDMLKDTPQKVTLDALFSQIKAGNVKDLNIVVKADVQGSVEAVKNSLERLSNDEVRIRIIHGGVGGVTESDVMLASASNAIIIGFNVRPEATAKSVADNENVDIRLYRIIYNAIEDISLAIKGLLDPVYQEKVIGHCEIRQLFKASGLGTIGGAYVTDGKFLRNAQVRIIRDSIVIYDGKLQTLKRFKDDVKEVQSGYECGLLFEKFNDIKEGDKVEAYIMEEIPR